MFLDSWIFKLTRNTNHVPGIVDFDIHQEHGWEHPFRVPRSTQFKGQGHSCMLVFRRTSHAKRIKSQVGCNQPCSWNRGFSNSPGTWLGNLLSESNTRFPIMFLEMFLGLWSFTLTRNMVGKPILQEQHTIPNHVPGVLDFHTHQEHGWEHLLVREAAGPGWWDARSVYSIV